MTYLRKKEWHDVSHKIHEFYYKSFGFFISHWTFDGTPKYNTYVFSEEIIEFVRELQDIKIKVIPSEVTFECEVSKPNADVHWLCDGQPLKRTGKYEVIADGTIHKLVIHDADGQDEKIYSASTKSNHTKARLIVEAAPEFDLGKLSETLTLKEGRSAVIEVPFRANPQPNVKWQYNKGYLPDKKRMKVDTINNMTSLCLSHVVTDDAGDYTLTLENDFGKGTYNVKVKVLGKLLLFV